MPRSISDDDLCADCAHCSYQPGDASSCALEWPGTNDVDGYVIACVRFVRIAQWGDNIASVLGEEIDEFNL